MSSGGPQQSRPDETPPPAALIDVSAEFLLEAEEGLVIDRGEIARRHPSLSDAEIRYILLLLESLGVAVPPRSSAISVREAQPRAPAGLVIVPATDSGLTTGFEVVEGIGEGGSGFVYRARLREDPSKPDIALKLLARGSGLHASRALRDAWVLRGFEHRNIVRVYAAGELTDGREFLATELVEGVNLKEWVQANGPLGDRTAAGVVLTLARALESAHGQRIIHCDVKPSNVFGCRVPLDPREVKLGDFGLSRFSNPDDDQLTAGSTLLGTLEHLAPEQYYDRQEQRSDIYAVGVLLVAITSGRDVLRADQRLALNTLRGAGVQRLDFAERRMRVLETFKAAGLVRMSCTVCSAQLRAICRRCLAFEMGERYQTAGDLAADLEAWLEDRPLAPETYRPRVAEGFTMLVRRCRNRENYEDHSRLWGLSCIAVGASALLLSGFCTILLLLGAEHAWTRRWTSSCYIGFSWFVVYPLTAWLTRGRRPTLQLIGYNFFYLIAFITIRGVLASDRSTADSTQFFVTGIVLGSVGLSSRYWIHFLYSGLLILSLSWPVALASRQLWFAPLAPLVLGSAQGLPLLAFGISYLWPQRGHGRA